MEQVRAFVEEFEPVDYKPKDRTSARHSRAASGNPLQSRKPLDSRLRGNDDLKKTITE